MADRAITGIHRTFLTADGTKKAPISQDKNGFELRRKDQMLTTAKCRKV